MAFRKPKKQPEFADLKGILAQSRDTDNALYQTVQEIINRLTQFQTVTLEEVADINNSISESESIIINVPDKKRSFLTTADESVYLPKSSQLLAGPGIIFDDTIPNKRTIISTGGGGYWTPLTDGHPDEAHLIFANGEAIAVFVPI